MAICHQTTDYKTFRSKVDKIIVTVKLNTSKVEADKEKDDHYTENSSEELTHMIDGAIDHFFDNHIIRVSALGKETSLPMPNNGKF